jgi:hypothetical protein
MGSDEVGMIAQSRDGLSEPGLHMLRMVGRQLGRYAVILQFRRATG